MLSTLSISSSMKIGTFEPSTFVTIISVSILHGDQLCGYQLCIPFKLNTLPEILFLYRPSVPSWFSPLASAAISSSVVSITKKILFVAPKESVNSGDPRQKLYMFLIVPKMAKTMIVFFSVLGGGVWLDMLIIWGIWSFHILCVRHVGHKTCYLGRMQFLWRFCWFIAAGGMRRDVRRSMEKDGRTIVRRLDGLLYRGFIRLGMWRWGLLSKAYEEWDLWITMGNGDASRVCNTGKPLLFLSRWYTTG